MGEHQPKVVASVTSSGRPLRRFDSSETQAYAECQSVAADLGFAVGFLEELERRLAKEEPTTVSHALWVAAVVSYGRCFGEGLRHRYRIDESAIGKLGDGALSLHQWLRSMRDKHIAHSVNPFEQIAVGVVLGPDHSVLGIAYQSMFHVGLQLEDAQQVGRLVRSIRDLVAVDAERLSGEALVAAQALSAEETVELPEMGFAVPGPHAAKAARRPAGGRRVRASRHPV